MGAGRVPGPVTGKILKFGSRPGSRPGARVSRLGRKTRTKPGPLPIPGHNCHGTLSEDQAEVIILQVRIPILAVKIHDTVATV